MCQPLRCFLTLLLTLCCLTATNLASAQQSEILWARNLQEAEARAKAEGKVVQLHFGATWCGPCRQLESFVFRQPEIIAQMNQNVVPVQIDIDKHKDLAKKYAISKIPQDVFLGHDGEVLYRRISPNGSQNYGLMLNTAFKIAAESSRQSRMAAEAIAAIGQKQTDAAQKSVFMDATAAAAGIADQQFAGSPHVSRNGVLPAATPAATAAVATNQLEQSVNKLASGLEVKGPEATFTAPDFQTPTMQTPADAFKNQSIAAHSIQARSPQQVITNPNIPSTDLAPRQQPIPAASPITEVANQTIAAAEQALPGRAENIGSLDTHPNQNQQVTATQPAAGRQPTLGLDGYCPVTLLREQRWVKGDPAFGRVHRGKVYLFASAEMAKEFFQTPDTLSPALAGFDPVLFTERGELVEGSRKFGVFCDTEVGLSIVLFANAENRDRFKQQREPFMKQIRTATTAADQR